MIEIMFFVVFIPTVALVGAIFIGLLMAGAVVGLGEHVEEGRELRERFERTLDQPAERPAPTIARAA